MPRPYLVLLCLPILFLPLTAPGQVAAPNPGPPAATPASVSPLAIPPANSPARKPAAAAQRIALWPKPVSPADAVDHETDPAEPTIDFYPTDGTAAVPSAAVICFPGGGYGTLSMSWEGSHVAAFLNQHHIAGFVVRYRHAPRYRYPLPLQDAQRAIRLVRSRAAEFHIVPDRIGVIGFSAGGNLVALTLTQFDAGSPGSPDPIEQVSSRPDFGMLIYSVITFTRESLVNVGSRRNFFGDLGNPALFAKLSPELNVRHDTPPAFLVHGGMDKTVNPENSILFYQACRSAGVPAELHLYQQGAHGLGDPTLQSWHDWAADWMFRNGWIKSSS